MEKAKLALALTGSFCTFEKLMPVAEALAEKYDLTVVMSETTANTDTRFGTAESFKTRLRAISGKDIVETIPEAEPAGPKKLFDIVAVAPCTGNTLAKLACGIADSAVTLLCKAHLRNGRPVVIAISTNDALGANARNIGELMNRKNYYFVPFRQDDPNGKPTSAISDMKLLEPTLEAALSGKQLQPVILISN
ncbi:MAG: dipicolinate synthase subunit B [Clostridia bacterium]|nr:dipicolinate synthase subunit B [Clostridia bacterium]